MERQYNIEIKAPQGVVTMNNSRCDNLKIATFGQGAEQNGNCKVEMPVLFTDNQLVIGSANYREEIDGLRASGMSLCPERPCGFKAEARDYRVTHCQEHEKPSGGMSEDRARQRVYLMCSAIWNSDGKRINEIGRFK
jgi:hypothetical protein